MATESTLISSEPLTADDIKALKQAEYAIFRQSVDGQGSIIAVRDRRDQTGSIWTIEDGADRAKRIINVTSHVADYQRDHAYGWKHQCFEQATSYNEVWRSIVSLLRVGDLVRLHWLASNNSQTLRDANLHHDELQIKIVRGKHDLTFNLEDRICPDGSTARMVRPA